MKKVFSFIFVIAVCSFIVDAQEIVSPNKNIKVLLGTGTTQDGEKTGQVHFSILYKKGARYIEVVPQSALGITRKDQQFVTNLRLVRESKAAAIHDKYTMITGKRKLCENFGTEKVFSYTNSNNQPLDIVLNAKQRRMPR